MVNKEKKLGIESLKALGAFAGEPVKKDVEWEQDGEKLCVTTFIRKLSYKSAVSDVRSFGDAGEMVAGRIAACVCDEEGNPVFTVDDITGKADPKRGPLNHNLTVALLNVIAEVNSSGKVKA